MYRELFGVGTKDILNRLTYFYANMSKQGPKDLIYYGTSVKGIDFSLSVATLD